MIQLTREQSEILKKSGSPRPHFSDPQTQEIFVLVPLAEFELLSGDNEYDDSAWTDEERDRLRLEACEMLDSFGKEP